jgi:aminoglycoside phosphotransferase (APT) family kinase protein
MSGRKMHVGEVDIDPVLVRRLLESQFPHWADLEIDPVPSGGTDNVMYRLGADMAARLPRIERTKRQVEQEAVWLPILAPRLPLAIPEQIALGAPGEGYPFPWAIVPWLPGVDAGHAAVDMDTAASDLGGFVAALQRIDTTGAPRPGWENAGRGMPLAPLNEYMRGAIAQLDDDLDRDGLLAIWDAAVAAPSWEREPVCIHGDLNPDNLLVVDGRLSAVIDFGCMAAGDPACELLPAWSLFPGAARDVYREAIGADDAMWARARGWIVMPAVTGLSYYANTDPSMVERARRSLEVVITEFNASA